MNAASLTNVLELALTILDGCTEDEAAAVLDRLQGSRVFAPLLGRLAGEISKAAERARQPNRERTNRLLNQWWWPD